MAQENLLSQSATPLPPSLNPQILYSWKAPLRAYKKRSKYILRFYITVALLLSVIIFFLGDHILIIPIWSVLFLFYVLTITPPPEIENRITKFGLETAGITLRWEALSHFYFTSRFGFEILTIVTHGPYYFHAYLVIPRDSTKKQVMKILAEHIVYQEKPTLTLTDHIIKWLSYLMPDDESPAGSETGSKNDKEDRQIAGIKDTLASFFQKRQNSSPARQSVVPNE
ncbi:hypothetical protein A2861_03000 [Candidatus Roizmanbacteria bacterium RIFCSPHIGHO2_01_FULL_38_15]|nr:MAG: hypothetical protein A2861_03000 [Candidatus Roizmanbacteria bacterium RIFCSPHIGHO2_01_FULL_38_15]